MIILQKNRLAKAILFATLTGSLAACGALDGDDGQDGIDGRVSNGADGIAGSNGTDGTNGTDGHNTGSALTRLATVPLGAEVTGAFLTENGDLFFNVQHPDSNNAIADANGKVVNSGSVGVLTGVDMNKLPMNLVSSPVPISDTEKQTVMTAYGQYQILGQTNEVFNSLPTGLGNTYAVDGTTLVVENHNPDYNGFIQTADNEGYLFTNWEHIMGGMSRMKLSKNAESGLWAVDSDDVTMLDFGKYGTVANCFGSVTPWNTPLSSEEWGGPGEATYAWNNVAEKDGAASFAAYTAPGEDVESASVFPNIYRYHYILEVKEPTSATPTPIKHFAMGRYAHENGIVMPDEKTVYLSDDSTGGVFFKFVADVAKDLTAGTLYAAKVTQDAGSDEPMVTGFDVEWIELAHGSNDEIETWISEYDAIDFDDYVADRSSYLTDADAIAWAAGEAKYLATNVKSTAAEDAGYEAENLYAGAVTAGRDMDNRVAFLESRRAARAKGATAEWRKFEGVSINQKRAKEAVEGVDLVAGETVEDAYVYFAISYMNKTMTDGVGVIHLSPRVSDCGGVYRMKLEAGYDVNRIEPVVMGSTYRGSLDKPERCDVNSLSQPDNVIVMDDGRLVIGEDGFQTNNTLWMYNPKVND